MAYELNNMAYREFIKWRAECNKKGVRDSKGRKIAKMTKLAQTRFKNHMKRFEPAVQRGMVKKSMDKFWTDVYAPKGTLHLDGKNPQKPVEMPCPNPKLAGMVSGTVKPVPVKYSSPKKVDAERKKLRAMLGKLDEAEDLKKGSDLDPFWQQQIEHAEK